MIGNYYLWLKALHVIAVVAWMAGLLYLPRLYVYHAQVAAGSEASELFKVMERRLLRGIVNPAMGAVFGLGILLVVETKAGMPGSGYWLHAKLALVMGLLACHGMMARFRKDFLRDANRHSVRFYKIFNEVPAVLMVLIVLLAFLKPF